MDLQKVTGLGNEGDQPDGTMPPVVFSPFSCARTIPRPSVSQRRGPTIDRVNPPPASRLGATWIPGVGTRVAVWSRHATAMQLCLPDHGQAAESPRRVNLQRMDSTHTSTPIDPDVWVGVVSDLLPGQRYGLRAEGPWQPEHAHVFNPDKLLVDPYAYALTGLETYDPQVARTGVASDPWRRDNTDSAAHVPWSVVIDHSFDWGDDHPPGTPMHRSVMYEAHVRGLTMRHPGIADHLRGTYAGIAHPAIVEHLQRLGVTALELLPIHCHLSEAELMARGLSNYWGYNTLGFFAPHPAYAAATDPQEQVHEVKAMVKTLHEAGIEVLLDVVYNHTCEGGYVGPTLSLRGLDNAEYYRRNPGHPLHYADVTGCGNSIDFSKPHVTAMVMDSLRYWVTHYHVDGFRFDLATTLGRASGGYFDPASMLFTAMRQDPVLATVKLIAEPWDVGDGGYQVGYFPAPLAEWNDSFRNDVRDFWLTRHVDAAALTARLEGSTDRFTRRGPSAAINYVCVHDGFTLADLVSYTGKHNQANGEDNRDGESHNRSGNFGAEGPTQDPVILGLRRLAQRNLLATLFAARAVPLVLAGDELSNSQQGNNNAYCQDNELGWVTWPADHPDHELTLFVTQLAALRRALTTRGWPTFAWHPLDPQHPQTHTPDSTVITLAAPLGGPTLTVVVHRGEQPQRVHLPSVDEQTTSYHLLVSTEAETGRTPAAPFTVTETGDLIIDTSVSAITTSAKPIEIPPRSVTIFLQTQNMTQKA